LMEHIVSIDASPETDDHSATRSSELQTHEDVRRELEELRALEGLGCIMTHQSSLDQVATGAGSLLRINRGGRGLVTALDDAGSASGPWTALCDERPMRQYHATLPRDMADMVDMTSSRALLELLAYIPYDELSLPFLFASTKYEQAVRVANWATLAAAVQTLHNALATPYGVVPPPMPSADEGDILLADATDMSFLPFVPDTDDPVIIAMRSDDSRRRLLETCRGICGPTLSMLLQTILPPGMLDAFSADVAVDGASATFVLRLQEDVCGTITEVEEAGFGFAKVHQLLSIWLPSSTLHCLHLVAATRLYHSVLPWKV